MHSGLFCVSRGRTGSCLAGDGTYQNMWSGAFLGPYSCEEKIARSGEPSGRVRYSARRRCARAEGQGSANKPARTQPAPPGAAILRTLVSDGRTKKVVRNAHANARAWLQLGAGRAHAASLKERSLTKTHHRTSEITHPSITAARNLDIPEEKISPARRNRFGLLGLAAAGARVY